MDTPVDRVIGIDFGISTTVVASIVSGDSEIIKTSTGQRVIPSFVALPPTGRPLVGHPAKERYPIDPRNTLHSVKRIIGEQWTSPAVRQFVDQYPFFSLERYDDDVPRFSTRQGLLSAEDVSAKMFEYIRELVKRWAPVRAEYGHRLVGAYETLMSDTEVCTIWATTLRSHVTLGRAMDDARGFGTADHPDERLVSWVRYRRNWCTRFREELMIPCPGTPMGPSEWRSE